MENLKSKPKLVYFQAKYNPQLPEFTLIHKQEHVNCLSLFFDVTVINEDADYLQVCELYQPELAVFESGLNLLNCRRPKITNIGACPTVPRVGLLNADAWCETRAGTISDMEHLGIETFFSISSTAIEHTPSIADKLFIWPVAIDSDVYHDYQLAKTVPVLLTGSTDPQYPWRHRVYKLISEVYPSLSCPHRGYHLRTSPGQVIFGEKYARMINASQFVPACGTVAKEAVRKHFEVPGCRACLISEKSQTLAAAGFVDMENCVLADETDVLDKMDYLFRNPSDLQRIIDAGFELVQGRHTYRHRDQIRQWFELNRQLKSEQKIIQENPFGGLRITNVLSDKNARVGSDSLHLSLLREGDSYLWSGRYDEAEKSYLKCTNYMRRMPEPKLKLAVAMLYRGQAKIALDLILDPLDYVLAEYKAADPDPVEWAYYVLALLCDGRLGAGTKRASEFPELRHIELDRIRWVVRVLNREREVLLPDEKKGSDRPSIHQMPDRSLEDWSAQVERMFMSSGKPELADDLKKAVLRGTISPGGTGDAAPAVCFGHHQRELKKMAPASLDPNRRAVVSWPVLFGYRRIRRRIRTRGQRAVRNLLATAREKLSRLAPYLNPEAKNDQFVRRIESLATDDAVQVMLVIGAAVGKQPTEALLSGLAGERTRRQVFCIGSDQARRKISGKWPLVKSYQVLNLSPEKGGEILASTIRRIKEENRISHFDAILVDGSEMLQHVDLGEILQDELQTVKYVLLDDTNQWDNYQFSNRLRTDPAYELVDVNHGERAGYAVFRRDGQETLNSLRTRREKGFAIQC